MADMIRCAQLDEGTYIVLTRVRDDYWLIETFDGQMKLLGRERHGSEAAAVRAYERPIAVAQAEAALHRTPITTKELK